MATWGGKREGAGRKPKVPGEKRKPLSVTISESNLERARECAERTGQTLSEVVDAMIGVAVVLPQFREAPQVLERLVPQQGAVDEAAERQPR